MRSILRRMLVPLLAAFLAATAARGQTRDMPEILSVRAQAATINQLTAMRLERLLPRIMEETGFDMWIIVSNEDALDPVFKTMIPYNLWCPITQILVFSKKPGRPVERFNVSRTDMLGMHVNAWDWRAWDNARTESQWDCLARLVRERDPRTIGINESDEIWAAGGLTSSLKARLARAIGPELARRFRSAEPLTVLWLETLLDEELAVYERVIAVAHALIAETFSSKAITPGVTTVDDLLYHYCQRISDLGLKVCAWPTFRIRNRDAETVKKYGADDKVIRRGDYLQTDAGLEYLRFATDHCEWAYVLKPGETDVPAGVQAAMLQTNRLQDVFLAEFKAGRTGNEILASALKAAAAAGIRGARIYSHGIGPYLHEPGPLLGLPWEQVNTGARGDVRLVPDSTFTAELSTAAPVPEWGGREFRVALEQVFAFTDKGTYFLDGRQTRFHLVK
ncbi:MAG: M24 family metallopeptidase [Acidobacteriota bacterium]